MSDVDILITNRTALDEALEIHPFDEESQIELLMSFIDTLDVDDQFQVFVLNAAHEEKKAHDLFARTRAATCDNPDYTPIVHDPSCDMDEDCSCQVVVINANGDVVGTSSGESTCDCCRGEGHEGPCCPGWLHCESDTYGWEVDVCEECLALHPEFEGLNLPPEGEGDPGLQMDKVVAAHDATCACNMGRGKCAPKTKGVAPEHCYASRTEMKADFARREQIAMRLKEQGRL
jgi:hypothetical protein